MHVISNALDTDQTIEQNTELTEQGVINADVDVLTGATFIAAFCCAKLGDAAIRPSV